MRLILLFCLFFGNASTNDVSHLRQLFIVSYSNEQAALELFNSSRRTPASPLLAGYKGVGSIMMCNHTRNPYSKWRYFSDGKRMLENAISQDPVDVELRFLRFAVQSNAPAFLRYNHEMQEDKKTLLHYLQQPLSTAGDTELRSMILVYLGKTRTQVDKY